MSVSFVMPALLTTISSRPTSRPVASTSLGRFGHVAGVHFGHATGGGDGIGGFLELVGTARQHAHLRARAASRRAIALPMPREAPVTIAVLAAKINLNPPILFVSHYFSTRLITTETRESHGEVTRTLINANNR